MEAIWSALTTVWGWIKNANFAVPLAGVLFCILVLALGKFYGLSQTDTIAGVAIIVTLSVGILILNNFALDRVLRTVASWGLVLLFLYAAYRIVVSYTNRIDAENRAETERIVAASRGEIKRVPYDSPFIASYTGLPVTMLTPANVPVGAGADLTRIQGMDKVWQWVSDGLEFYRHEDGPDGKPLLHKNQRAVVVRSSKKFGKAYDPISVTITINRNIQIQEGVVFLKSVQGGTVNYRQMACKCDVTSDTNNGADFTLFNPDPEEEVFLIIRCQTKDPKGELSGETDNYGITLKVNQ